MDSPAVPLLAGVATVATGGAAAPAFASMSTIGQIATVASIGSSLFGAYQGYTAGLQEEADLEEQARAERVRAAQEEANRQEELTRILNLQMAASAGRGVQVGSGTDLAIAKFSEEEAARESGIAATDSAFRQNQFKSQARQARKSGTASLITGVVNAGVSGYDRISKANELKRTTTN